MSIVKNKCKDCQAEYKATKSEFDNGDITTSPPRCVPCQTAHLTNLRVNTTVKKIRLLGNLKARLDKEERDAVITAIKSEVEALMDRYAGSPVKTSAFDLKKVKAKV